MVHQADPGVALLLGGDAVTDVPATAAATTAAATRLSRGLGLSVDCFVVPGMVERGLLHASYANLPCDSFDHGLTRHRLGGGGGGSDPTPLGFSEITSFITAST